MDREYSDRSAALQGVTDADGLFYAVVEQFEDKRLSVYGVIQHLCNARSIYVALAMTYHIQAEKATELGITPMPFPLPAIIRIPGDDFIRFVAKAITGGSDNEPRRKPRILGRTRKKIRGKRCGGKR